MHAIGNMALFDVRARLPRANWEIGRRQGNPEGIVLHYNGPAVAPESQSGEGLIQKLIRNARWHMRPGSLGAASGGDGLQYHVCVASDGQVLWMRDLEAQLWHCGSPKNSTHLAIYLPLGQAQQPSTVQWQQCTALMDALIAHYGWKGRNVVRAHREESQTACPGNVVMGLLNQYRTPAATPDTSVKGTYRTTLRVLLRQAPQRHARNIVRVLPGGQKVEVGALVQGEAVQGDSRWAWLSSGEGFIHFPHLERVA